MREIKVGDVVELKSGGERMTVTKIDSPEGLPATANVAWHPDGATEFMRDYIIVDALKKHDDQA